jgi:hypothetical protein
MQASIQARLGSPSSSFCGCQVGTGSILYGMTLKSVRTQRRARIGNITVCGISRAQGARRVIERREVGLDNGARTIQLACFGIVRRRCNCLHVRSLSKPPPLIELEAQRAARSRACLFVCADDALQKRASAYKALIRMVSVVLTCIAGKPPMREHPIPPAIKVVIPT